MQRLKATDLILDQELYPRGSVNSQHINYMVRSLEAGQTLPPIIVDKKTRTIVDGVHRWNAQRKFADDEAVEVECILKTYKTTAELFLDAVRLNAAHGVTLTNFDRVKCLIRAQELKITDTQIADALCMTTEKAGALRQERLGHCRVQTASKGKAVAFSKSRYVPLKRSIRHMSGKPLTERQVEINERLSGMDASFHVNQLLMLIEGELLDLSDKRLANGLRRLVTELEKLPVPAR